jgi:ATP-dependent DNA ligase
LFDLFEENNLRKLKNKFSENYNSNIDENKEMEFVSEYKYDGQRGIFHFPSKTKDESSLSSSSLIESAFSSVIKDEPKLFSRNGEDYTFALFNLFLFFYYFS